MTNFLDAMREQAAAKEAELEAAGIPRVACADYGVDDGVDRWWDCSRTFAVYLVDGICGQCRTERRLRGGRAQEAARLQEYRERKRLERQQAARTCVMCDGPLWPEGEPVTRARSDKVTCSAKCRQRARRADDASALGNESVPTLEVTLDLTLEATPD